MFALSPLSPLNTVPLMKSRPISLTIVRAEGVVYDVPKNFIIHLLCGL